MEPRAQRALSALKWQRTWVNVAFAGQAPDRRVAMDSSLIRFFEATMAQERVPGLSAAIVREDPLGKCRSGQSHT